MHNSTAVDPTRAEDVNEHGLDHEPGGQGLEQSHQWQTFAVMGDAAAWIQMIDLERLQQRSLGDVCMSRWCPISSIVQYIY